MIRSLFVALPLALLVAADVGARPTRADAVCCGPFGGAGPWGGATHFASCFATGSCAAGQVKVAVSYADAPTCPKGSYQCVVSALPRCCLWDCKGEPLCSSAEPPSCCNAVNPYCGYGIHKDPTTGKDEPSARTLNPLCDAGPKAGAACCADTSIQVPATLSGASGEWIVVYGSQVK